MAAVFTADGTNVELLGVDITALGLYLIGLGSGLAILWGFGLTKWGTKRSLRQRRESKQLSELSEKLDKHDAERRQRRRQRATTAATEPPGPARASAARSAGLAQPARPGDLDAQPHLATGDVARRERRRRWRRPCERPPHSRRAPSATAWAAASAARSAADWARRWAWTIADTTPEGGREQHQQAQAGDGERRRRAPLVAGHRCGLLGRRDRLGRDPGERQVEEPAGPVHPTDDGDGDVAAVVVDADRAAGRGDPLPAGHGGADRVAPGHRAGGLPGGVDGAHLGGARPPAARPGRS